MYYEMELERLNEYQKEAVLDESTACIVNANVGSGKTTVLISKLLYLRYTNNISYKDMIVLTFTNKAANEIKERLIAIDSLIQPEDLKGFGTFHSTALHLLKNMLPVEKIGYTNDFLVIEPEEELDIALQLIQEEKLCVKYKNRLKKRLEEIMSLRLEEQEASSYKDDILKLAQLLKTEKIKQNKMTFSDLLHNAIMLLKDYKLAIKWIIIDEVQDSDNLQLDFIDKLKGDSTKLFAVGDPNQIIYSWRGSAMNVVYKLKYKYGAKELSLPINYRSSSSILEAAKCFLQFENTLTGIRDTDNKIIVKKHYNPFNEACYLVDKIKELHTSGVSYNEIAIFYRLQEQSQVFEDVFSKNELPYEVSLKKTVRDIPVLNWLIKLFRFSVNQKDTSSGIYVLSNKDYGEKIKEAEASKIIKGLHMDKSKLLEKMLKFSIECSELKQTEELYNYFEFDNYIRPTSATFKEDKEYIVVLLNIIMDYMKEKQMPFWDSLKDFISSSALYGVNILTKDINSKTDSVKLMTLHASKGLEFSYVFITGVNYGLIPLQSKGMEEEEEGRLFFVGITRAKDYLELSYYTNPDIQRVTPGESRYIRMIPSRLILDETIDSATVNLKDLKNQIKQLKNEKDKEDTSIEEIIEVSEKLVKHFKYGTGKVLKEDDTMIEVDFENYGVKEFIKAFSELEFLY